MTTETTLRECTGCSLYRTAISSLINLVSLTFKYLHFLALKYLSIYCNSKPQIAILLGKGNEIKQLVFTKVEGNLNN